MRARPACAGAKSGSLAMADRKYAAAFSAAGLGEVGDDGAVVALPPVDRGVPFGFGACDQIVDGPADEVEVARQFGERIGRRTL